MSQAPQLTILMPCLNEAATLPACILRAQQLLETLAIPGEVLVADNGSTDGSVALAKTAGARVIAVSERGYGAALAAGIAAAAAPFVIMADADGSYDFMDGINIYRALQDGATLVIGNRFQGGIAPKAMPPLNRWLGNPVLSALGRLFFELPIGDFHCGIRGVRRDALLALDLRTTGMEYASEMIVRAALAQQKLAEVPVTLRPDGRGRKSHLRPFADGWRHLRFLLLYSPRWLYLYPGLFMIIFGMVLGGVLLPGPVQLTENIGLDIHSLLVAALAVIIGTQAISFGLIARTSAAAQGLIPSHAKLEKALNFLTTDNLLKAGAILVLLGIGGVLWCGHLWSAVDFGALNYSMVMRFLILAATAMVVGIQAGFTGFMLGLVQIKRRATQP